MKNIIKSIVLVVLFSLILFPFGKTLAQETTDTDKKFLTYVGGIGCPHCAVISPFLHEKVNSGDVIMIEYEMYKNLANASVLNDFADNYQTSLGIPLIVFDKVNKEAGDAPIKSNWDTMYSNVLPGIVHLPDGSSVEWENLSLNDLRRYPNIYGINRIAIRKSITTVSDEQNTMIKNFISERDINVAVEGLEGKSVRPSKFSNPGGTIEFDNAMEVNGWLLQWDGPSVDGTNDSTSSSTDGTNSGALTIGKTIALALADSVNPCAISVLALMLLSIVTYNPGNRKQVLLSGLAFVLAVVVMYLLYGFLIVKAFEFIQSIAEIKLYLYRGLGAVAIILGLLEIKDYFKYKPGGVATEMPMSMRPKMQNLIAKVTSPVGAFGMGLFVTLFLLPCTIGPYIILGGLIAEGGFVPAIPYLLLYNLIFVLPMIIITLIVFFGSKKVEDISDWRERNVRKMHLIAGIAMLAIGILMVTGII